jgi:hypothetical protein
MATVRVIASPPDLEGATSPVLSPDGRTVACRLEGERAGLFAFEVGGVSRPLMPDDSGRVHHALRWTDLGDLLVRISSPDGIPRVGVHPAPGRGGPVEYEGTGIAVSADGRIVAVSDPRSEQIRVGTAESGNAPFHRPLERLAAFVEADPLRTLEMDLTRDGAFLFAVRHPAHRSPALWSYSLTGGDAQEVVPPVPAPALLSFAVSAKLLAVLELRRGPEPSSMVYVRPIAGGALGAIRLGPARGSGRSRSRARRSRRRTRQPAAAPRSAAARRGRPRWSRSAS